MAKWIEQIFAGSHRVAMPIMTHPGIEYIHRTVREAVTDGQVQFDAIRAVVERFDMAACTVIMDLTVEAEAFGAAVDFPQDEVPRIVGRLVSNAENVSQLPVPDLSQGRLPQYLKVNRLAAACFTDRPVFAGCIGPYSLAGRLFGMSEIMVSIYLEPDVIHALLEKCTRFLLAYCTELKRQGVSGVIMAEPAAGLLSDEDCGMFSTAYVSRIVQTVQDDTFTVILHNCGNSGQCTRAMVDSGAAALHFGNAISMVEALRDCPADVVIMGNLDPVGVLRQGSPSTVYGTTMDLLHQTADFSNFVLSTGCDVPPLVPEDNIRSMYLALHHYNAVCQ